MDENKKPISKDATAKGFQKRNPLPKTTMRLYDNSKSYKTKNFNIRRNGER